MIDGIDSVSGKRNSISFIGTCFKIFLDQLCLKRPKVLIAEKKTLKNCFFFSWRFVLSKQVKTSKSCHKNIRLL